MQQDDIARMILRDRERGASQLEAEYRERLYSVAFALCHDATEAEDLVFRTMERVIEKIETYEERDSFYDWMCVILQNLYRDSCRSKMVRGTVPVGGPAEMEPFAQTVDADTVIEAVDAEITRRALEKIPPQMREVLILHYFMDMSVKQIARTLMVAPGTVMSRLYHARRVLAQRLGANLKKPAVAMIAAGLMLLGATAAVVVGVDALVASETGGTRSASCDLASQGSSLRSSGNPTPTARANLAASETGGTRSSASSEIPSTDTQQSTTDNQLKGENAMTKRKAATAALTAAIAAAPLAAANGDEYQFIVSGDPVAAETAGISSSSSETVPLTVGTLSGGFVHESEFEARSRTVDESSTNVLRSDKFKGIIISVK